MVNEIIYFLNLLCYNYIIVQDTSDLIDDNICLFSCFRIVTFIYINYVLYLWVIMLNCL